MPPTDPMTPQRLHAKTVLERIAQVAEVYMHPDYSTWLRAHADQLESNAWEPISTDQEDYLVERLREDFQSEEARYGYVESHSNTVIAAQIRSTREQREISQEQLAKLIGTKQPGIARLENCNYDSWKVETLRKIARALGVRLSIRFEEFGTLPREIQTFKDRLTPRPFQDDPVFALPKPPEAK